MLGNRYRHNFRKPRNHFTFNKLTIRYQGGWDSALDSFQWHLSLGRYNGWTCYIILLYNHKLCVYMYIPIILITIYRRKGAIKCVLSVPKCNRTFSVSTGRLGENVKPWPFFIFPLLIIYCPPDCWPNGI